MGHKKHQYPIRPGPEADLVVRFSSNHLPPPADGEQRIVLFEPAVEFTRPDIVVIYWNPSVAEKWPTARRLLRPVDFRLLHLFHTVSELTDEAIQRAFPNVFDKCLRRLEKAQLIYRCDGAWHKQPLGDTFAVHRIMTFEAKISLTSRALDQALLNTWFATTSYVLLQGKRIRSSTIDKATRLGIGIWSLDREEKAHLLREAQPHEIPNSYATWCLNELVWAISME